MDSNNLRHSFGMVMPGRSFSGSGYRFGFNGKEKDDEIKGAGNSLDFGARIYDSRVGRWLSVDPDQMSYPGFSTYNFCANNSIYFIDPDGKKIMINYIDASGVNKSFEYSSTQMVPNNKFVKDAIQSLDYISQSKSGNKQVKFAVESDCILNIIPLTGESSKADGPSTAAFLYDDKNGDDSPSKDEILKDKEGNYLPGNMISWDPNSKGEIKDDDGNLTGNTQSASVMLAHELTHWNGATKNLKSFVNRLFTDDSRYQNKEERRATRMESKIARELGENSRKNHFGKILK